jgi:polygalacturonase
MKIVAITLLFGLFGYTASAQDYNILDYGAVGDGTTLNTQAIQTAIDQANSTGGGRVILPKGRFLSGTIYLKSNVELHLTKGALLLGSTQSSEYSKVSKWKALIQAKEATNIAISGSGKIDGQGAELALRLDSLFYAGDIDSVDYNVIEKRPKWSLRPQLIHFWKCNDIKVTGITLQNSACWVQTYERCNRVIIDNIKVESDAYWNNDGLDIVDSKNVRVTHCDINSSDDGICIKSEDFSHTYSCDSIYIADCTIRSSASAVKLGTSSVCDMRNITVRNIKVYDTYRSAIAIEAMQGGILENILVENITAKNTGNAIFLRIGKIRGVQHPGTLRNVTIRNITVTVPLIQPDINYKLRGPVLPFFHNVFPSSITGIPGHPIQDITLENITITYPGGGNPAYANMPTDRIGEIPEMITTYPEFSMFGELPAWGFYVRHVEGLTMKNICIKIKNDDYRPAMVLDDVTDLKITEFKVKGDKKPNPIFLKNVKKIKMDM